MLSRLSAIPGLALTENVPLSQLTRFALGGPARAVADASTESAILAALKILEETGTPYALIGGGSNLVASDEGFPGVILRFTGNRITTAEATMEAEAGALLQNLVDRSMEAGLGGIHTMTRIPGWVGGAVYGNAGAYGHSMHEFVQSVRFMEIPPPGTSQAPAVCEFDNTACQFRYRESIFKTKRRAGTVLLILSARLQLQPSDPAGLQARAREIQEIRDAKYPPSMCCAGSIFKNLILAELPEPVQRQIPERVIREGKVPSAYFLEQAGAKGMQRGGIEVAGYHANLIYNTGAGTAQQVREIVGELKARVADRFGLILEEEVQYLGF